MTLKDKIKEILSKKPRVSRVKPRVSEVTLTYNGRHNIDEAIELLLALREARNTILDRYSQHVSCQVGTCYYHNQNEWLLTCTGESTRVDFKAPREYKDNLIAAARDFVTYVRQENPESYVGFYVDSEGLSQEIEKIIDVRRRDLGRRLLV